MKCLIVLLCAVLFYASDLCAQEKLFVFNGFYNAPSSEKITKATRLKLDRSLLMRLYSIQDAGVKIELPVENTSVILDLKKSDLFSKNFRVTESNTFSDVPYTPGYHLRGKIVGEENSFAAISIFDDFVAGIVSFGGNNYNISVANNSGDHTGNDYVINTLQWPGLWTKFFQTAHSRERYIPEAFPDFEKYRLKTLSI